MSRGPLELAGLHWLNFAAGMSTPAPPPPASIDERELDDRVTLAELLATHELIGKRLLQWAARLDAVDVNDARQAGAEQARVADELRELAGALVHS